MTKRKFLISYVILLHFFLIFLILNPYSSDQRKRNPGLFPQSDEFPSPPAHQTELTEHYHRMLKYHKLMDGSVSNGTAVFIGDSMVQSLWVSGIAPLSVNYGIGGDTTVGVLNRISQYKSIERANIIVIAVGLNDMEFRNIDEIFENYKKIANSIPGNTPIIFSAVLPVNEHARNNMQGRNKQIRSLNMKLKQF